MKYKSSENTKGSFNIQIAFFVILSISFLGLFVWILTDNDSKSITTDPLLIKILSFTLFAQAIYILNQLSKRKKLKSLLDDQLSGKVSLNTQSNDIVEKKEVTILLKNKKSHSIKTFISTTLSEIKPKIDHHNLHVDFQCLKSFNIDAGIPHLKDCFINLINGIIKLGDKETSKAIDIIVETKSFKGLKLLVHHFELNDELLWEPWNTDCKRVLSLDEIFDQIELENIQLKLKNNYEENGKFLYAQIELHMDKIFVETSDLAVN